MKRFVSAMIFGACLLAVSPVVKAQQCNKLTAWDLRGTYTMEGSGWVNPAVQLPMIPGLPNQFVPKSWVGAISLNGAGGGSGWVSVNVAGTQMTIKLVDLDYSVSPNPDTPCAIEASFSMHFKEFGVTVGPFHRLLVAAVKLEDEGRREELNRAEELELHMIWKGAAPGAPGNGDVDSAVAHRISLEH